MEKSEILSKFFSEASFCNEQDASPKMDAMKIKFFITTYFLQIYAINTKII